MKKRIVILFALMAALFSLTADGATRTSANYSLTTETMDSGGNRTSSANYSNDGSLGEIGGISTAAAPAETVKHSYIGQLYDVIGVALSANPTTVNEGTTRQLQAAALLDDATVLPLAPALVSWSVSSGPINSIDAGGLATAGIVYQNTPALVRGDYLGQFGTLALNVLNVGLDDFGSYAGDGIDDAWQVQYFGLDNPAAGPARDPDGDGQNNVFEYTAGTDPTSALSRFNLAIARVPGEPDQENIIFSPRFPSRTYTVQFRDSLSGGLFAPLGGTTTNDVGPERTVTDLNATGLAKFYRVCISFP